MKHEGKHKLNFACLGCVNKHIEHKQKLLSFVRDLLRTVEHIDIQLGSAFHKNAIEILNEIKADSDERPN